MTRDLTVELKQLRLQGMAGAWSELVEHGTNAALDASRWLLEDLLQAERTDRALRSVSHQMGVSEILCVRRVSHLDTGEPVAVHNGELIHRCSPFLGRSYFVSQDIS